MVMKLREAVKAGDLGILFTSMCKSYNTEISLKFWEWVRNIRCKIRLKSFVWYFTGTNH